MIFRLISKKKPFCLIRCFTSTQANARTQLVQELAEELGQIQVWANQNLFYYYFIIFFFSQLARSNKSVTLKAHKVPRLHCMAMIAHCSISVLTITLVWVRILHLLMRPKQRWTAMGMASVQCDSFAAHKTFIAAWSVPLHASMVGLMPFYMLLVLTQMPDFLRH